MGSSPSNHFFQVKTCNICPSIQEPIVFTADSVLNSEVAKSNMFEPSANEENESGCKV